VQRTNAAEQVPVTAPLTLIQSAATDPCCPSISRRPSERVTLAGRWSNIILTKPESLLFEPFPFQEQRWCQRFRNAGRPSNRQTLPESRRCGEFAGAMTFWVDPLQPALVRCGCPDLQ
jgi:hypothetical protein